MRLFKYQGAGNDFLIADNRDGKLSPDAAFIASVCDRRYGVGADGLMLLEKSENHDFRMVYYNSDGSGGMMCGNGGRCIVAFAADCGISSFVFEAPDGLHEAQILHEEGRLKTVRLKMIDVRTIAPYERVDGHEDSAGWFLDTGTRHFVHFMQDLENADIIDKGRAIRWATEFGPIGTNVNFVEPYDGGIKVRTFEKGVEDETFACGTGIVASAVASWKQGVEPTGTDADGRVHYAVRARRDRLAVDFLPGRELVAREVFLTGPATFVATVEL